MAIPKGYIKQLREFRKVPAYIGRIVTYAGHPYRIASVKAGGLVLRSELLVHPQDDNIDYNPPANINQQSQQGEIERLYKRIEELEQQVNQQRNTIVVTGSGVANGCPKCGLAMFTRTEVREQSTAGTAEFTYLCCPEHGDVYLLSCH